MVEVLKIVAHSGTAGSGAAVMAEGGGAGVAAVWEAVGGAACV